LANPAHLPRRGQLACGPHPVAPVLHFAKGLVFAVINALAPADPYGFWMADQAWSDMIGPLD
jgi:hypothetical protein